MKLLSLTEAAKKLRIKRQSVWVKIISGRIKAKKVGNSYVISEKELNNHINKKIRGVK